MIQALGQPRTTNVTLSLPDHTEIPAPPSPYVPEYCVRLPSPFLLLHHCVSSPSTVHIKICDFGESFLWNPRRVEMREFSTPMIFRSPEFFFNEEHSPATDIWALAVLINMILGTREPLFAFVNAEAGSQEPTLAAHS